MPEAPDPDCTDRFVKAACKACARTLLQTAGSFWGIFFQKAQTNVAFLKKGSIQKLLFFLSVRWLKTILCIETVTQQGEGSSGFAGGQAA
ncbi:hypothetical protein [Komagataeibacter xylinus]|uniref:hypothetical protein n=1 Tax=Komagataeibacter xylinus TaxID=28448 RepID=UPI0013300AC9|nr:hypothetical protein [Komagataeibacter xylinus]